MCPKLYRLLIAAISSHVVDKKTDSGEFLTIIQNVSLSIVDDDDFSAI